MVCYLAPGWCITIRANVLSSFLNLGGISLLIGGGVAYTIRAIFYALEKRYYHSIFRFLILIGSVLHALCILLYLM